MKNFKDEELMTSFFPFGINEKDQATSMSPLDFKEKLVDNKDSIQNKKLVNLLK